MATILRLIKRIIFIIGYYIIGEIEFLFCSNLQKWFNKLKICFNFFLVDPFLCHNLSLIGRYHTYKGNCFHFYKSFNSNWYHKPFDGPYFGLGRKSVYLFFNYCISLWMEGNGQAHLLYRPSLQGE